MSAIEGVGWHYNQIKQPTTVKGQPCF